MATRITVGNVELFALTDYRFDQRADVPFPQLGSNDWSPFREANPALYPSPNEIDWRYTAFATRSGNQTILFDTGIGPRSGAIAGGMNADGRLIAELESVGIGVQDIGLVVLTHMHPDHVGWCTIDRSGSRVPTFSNARYLAHQLDWDEFSKPDWDHIPETVGILVAEGRIDLVPDQERRLTPELSLILTPGHTPGSMSVILESSGEQGFIVGDVLSSPAQLVHTDWNLVWDIDPATAAATRKQVVDRLQASGTPIASGHLGLGRLVWRDGKRGWEQA